MTNTKGAAATYSLAKCILFLRLADQYAQDAKREDIGGDARATLVRVSNRIGLTIQEFRGFLTAPSMKVLREELMPDERSQQFESILNMYIAMPQGIKDEIESYIESRYNIYKLNH